MKCLTVFGIMTLFSTGAFASQNCMDYFKVTADDKPLMTRAESDACIANQLNNIPRVKDKPVDIQ